MVCLHCSEFTDRCVCVCVYVYVEISKFDVGCEISLLHGRMSGNRDSVRFDKYRPPTKLWDGNVFTPVCYSFCSRRGEESCAWSHVPSVGVSVHEGFSVQGVSVPGGSPSPKRAVRILLECILVVQ